MYIENFYDEIIKAKATSTVQSLNLEKNNSKPNLPKPKNNEKASHLKQKSSIQMNSSETISNTNTKASSTNTTSSKNVQVRKKHKINF